MKDLTTFLLLCLSLSARSVHGDSPDYRPSYGDGHASDRPSQVDSHWPGGTGRPTGYDSRSYDHSSNHTWTHSTSSSSSSSFSPSSSSSSSPSSRSSGDHTPSSDSRTSSSSPSAPPTTPGPSPSSASSPRPAQQSDDRMRSPDARPSSSSTSSSNSSRPLESDTTRVKPTEYASSSNSTPSKSSADTHEKPSYTPASPSSSTDREPASALNATRPLRPSEGGHSSSHRASASAHLPHASSNSSRPISGSSGARPKTHLAAPASSPSLSNPANATTATSSSFTAPANGTHTRVASERARNSTTPAPTAPKPTCHPSFIAALNDGAGRTMQGNASDELCDACPRTSNILNYKSKPVPGPLVTGHAYATSCNDAWLQYSSAYHDWWNLVGSKSTSHPPTSTWGTTRVLGRPTLPSVVSDGFTRVNASRTAWIPTSTERVVTMAVPRPSTSTSFHSACLDPEQRGAATAYASFPNAKPSCDIGPLQCGYLRNQRHQTTDTRSAKWHDPVCGTAAFKYSTCSIYASKVQVLYWPEATHVHNPQATTAPPSATPSTIVSGGITFTYPSIYLSLEHVGLAKTWITDLTSSSAATDLAGPGNYLMSMPPEALSTVVYKVPGCEGLCPEKLHSIFSTRPLAGVHNHLTFEAQPYNPATLDPDQPIPASAYFWGKVDAGYNFGRTPLTALFYQPREQIIWDDYLPQIAVPDSIRQLGNGSWEGCGLGIGGIYDPPVALTQQTNLAGPTITPPGGPEPTSPPPSPAGGSPNVPAPTQYQGPVQPAPTNSPAVPNQPGSSPGSSSPGDSSPGGSSPGGSSPGSGSPGGVNPSGGSSFDAPPAGGPAATATGQAAAPTPFGGSGSSGVLGPSGGSPSIISPSGNDYSSSSGPSAQGGSTAPSGSTAGTVNGGTPPAGSASSGPVAESNDGSSPGAPSTSAGVPSADGGVAFNLDSVSSPSSGTSNGVPGQGSTGSAQDGVSGIVVGAVVPLSISLGSQDASSGQATTPSDSSSSPPNVSASASDTGSHSSSANGDSVEYAGLDDSVVAAAPAPALKPTSTDSSESLGSSSGSPLASAPPDSSAAEASPDSPSSPMSPGPQTPTVSAGPALATQTTIKDIFGDVVATAALVEGHTIVANGPASTINGHTISLATGGRNVVVDGVTAAAFPAASSQSSTTSANSVTAYRATITGSGAMTTPAAVVYGATLVAGGDSLIHAGHTYSAQQQGNVVVDGSKTIQVQAQSTSSSSGSSSTSGPRGTITAAALSMGASKTLTAIETALTDFDGKTTNVVYIGTQTASVGQTITADGTPVVVQSDGLVLGGTTAKFSAAEATASSNSTSSWTPSVTMSSNEASHPAGAPASQPSGTMHSDAAPAVRTEGRHLVTALVAGLLGMALL